MCIFVNNIVLLSLGDNVNSLCYVGVTCILAIVLRTALHNVRDFRNLKLSLKIKIKH